MSRSADHHPAFFAVYNMETTEIVAFYQVINYACSRFCVMPFNLLNFWHLFTTYRIQQMSFISCSSSSVTISTQLQEAHCI